MMKWIRRLNAMATIGHPRNHPRNHLRSNPWIFVRCESNKVPSETSGSGNGIHVPFVSLSKERSSKIKNTEKSKLKSYTLLKPVEFQELVVSFVNKVERAVQPMEEINELLEITKQKDSIGIQIGSSGFRITVDAKEQTLDMFSPISGTRRYQFNVSSQRWEDMQDSHDIEGLLTRDLMRLASGVPMF